MVAELLGTGAASAKTGKQLAAMLNTDIREITAAVEKERREGQPICATTNSNKPGYYLAASIEELEEYCGALQHRAAQLYKTRRALLKTLSELAAVKEKEA